MNMLCKASLSRLQLAIILFAWVLCCSMPSWAAGPSTIAPSKVSPPNFPMTPTKPTTITPPPVTTPSQPSVPPAPAPSPFPSSASFGQPLRQEPSGSIYTSPGIATNQGGQWVGSEHLYNLSPNIGIFPELVMQPGLPISITEISIREKLIPILRTGGVNATPLLVGKSPLPFLHVLVMITPIDKGYVAYCAIRLFEEIQNKRVFLPAEVIWQAITWEKQELILAPTEQIQEEIEKTLVNLAQAFADRYRLKQPESPGKLR